MLGSDVPRLPSPTFRTMETCDTCCNIVLPPSCRPHMRHHFPSCTSIVLGTSCTLFSVLCTDAFFFFFAFWRCCLSASFLSFLQKVNSPYVSTTLQLAPGIPLNRPVNGELLSPQSTWYEGMTFGNDSCLVREAEKLRERLEQ